MITITLTVNSLVLTDRQVYEEIVKPGRAVSTIPPTLGKAAVSSKPPYQIHGKNMGFAITSAKGRGRQPAGVLLSNRHTIVYPIHRWHEY